MWVRAVGLIGVIFYGIAGAFTGLLQQRVGLPPDQIDCDYRVELLADRVVALTERSPQQSLRDPQDDVVFTLIRETQTACADDDAQSARLQLIGERLREHQRVRAQEAEARRELLAL
jgi:hypothetical protein